MHLDHADHVSQEECANRGAGGGRGRGEPGSGEHAGLIVVGGEEAQQAAPEVPKLLLAVLPQNALAYGLQGHIPRHAPHHLLHPPRQHMLQGCQPLCLHTAPWGLPLAAGLWPAYNCPSCAVHHVHPIPGATAAVLPAAQPACLLPAHLTISS